MWLDTDGVTHTEAPTNPEAIFTASTLAYLDGLSHSEASAELVALEQQFRELLDDIGLAVDNGRLPVSSSGTSVDGVIEAINVGCIPTFNEAVRDSISRTPLEWRTDVLVALIMLLADRVSVRGRLRRAFRPRTGG